MTTVLVTGATGFVGSALCRKLCDLDYDVIAFHRYSSTIDQIEKLPLRRMIGDLLEDGALENVFSQKPDIVIHLAAQHVSGRNASRLLDVNVGGTRRILQASFNSSVKRVIFMSSALTMGTAEPAADFKSEPMPVTESHQWNNQLASWPFARSKHLAEQEIQWASAYGLDVVTLNPMTITGAGDHYRKLTSLIARYQRTPPAYSIAGGINLIDVQDVVQGIVNAIQYGEKGKRYLLGGTNLSYSELFRILSEMTGAELPGMQLPSGLSNRLFDFKIKNLDFFSTGSDGTDLLQLAGKYLYFDGRNSRLALRLSPPRDIRQSIKETLEWFEQNL